MNIKRIAGILRNISFWLDLASLIAEIFDRFAAKMEARSKDGKPWQPTND